jgi:hypothetical protein
MSPHLLPHSTIRRVCSRFAILRSHLGGQARNLMVAVGLTGIVGTSLADPPMPNLPSRSEAVSNTALSRSVRLAIDADPELRGVNLVVSVVDGVAVIGGPVSSPSVAKRVEWVVRRVPDIKDVKNGCFVISGPDPLMTALAEKMGTAPPTRPAMPELPGVLTGSQPPALSFPPLPNAQNSSLVATAPNPNTVVAQKPSIPAGGVLGAPVSPVGAGAGSTPSSGNEPASNPGPVLGKLTASGGTAQTNANGILMSAANVKKVEARFANLTIELNNGILQIGGTSPRASDAWDLAEKLRQIPGVTRVVIAQMPGKP